jgi:hypothetical protein
MGQPDWEQLYYALREASDSLGRVLAGCCPKCGAVREDNNCRACGHHSIYVEPVKR